MLRVELSLLGSQCLVNAPAGFLGDDLFKAFREATNGARYDRATKRKLCTLGALPGVLVRLRDAGFDAVLSKELRAKLAETTAHQWQDYHNARERLSRIDRDIFERHGEKLFSYQYTGAVWLTLRQGGAALFDDQGTGKTRSLLVSLPPNAPVLVVCPASVKSVWLGETNKLRPNMKPRALEGRASFRWPKDGELLAANFELLPEVHDTEGKKGRACDGYLEAEKCGGCKDELVTGPFGDMKLVRTAHESHCNGFRPARRCPGCGLSLDGILPGTVLIVDEAQYVKSSKAERSHRVRAIASRCREIGGKSIVSTGTPLENEPGELWNVLEAAGLGAEAFGDWNGFLECFKGRKEDGGKNGRSFGYSWDETPDDAVVERLRRVSLRRTKADVQADLPPKLYQDRIVPIDRKALANADAFLRGHGGANRIEALLQTEVTFETMSEILAALAMAKLPALLKIIEDEYESLGKPLLVFASHRAPVETLGKKRGWETILGGTKDRGDIVERFQAGKLKGLACTIQAAGTGLTLHKSDTAIFLSRMFNPMQNIQAEDRLHRIGQKATVNVVSLVADHPLDRRIAEITAKKIRMFNASVGASSVETTAKEDAGKTAADRAFEEYLKRIDDEVKGRPLPRNMAAAGAETEALFTLEHAFFPKRSDEKLATELTEEAHAVGLSEPRWRLAVALAERAVKEPEEVEAEAIAPARETKRTAVVTTTHVPHETKPPESGTTIKGAESMSTEPKDPAAGIAKIKGGERDEDAVDTAPTPETIAKVKALVAETRAAMAALPAPARTDFVLLLIGEIEEHDEPGFEDLIEEIHEEYFADDEDEEDEAPAGRPAGSFGGGKGRAR